MATQVLSRIFRIVTYLVGGAVLGFRATWQKQKIGDRFDSSLAFATVVAHLSYHLGGIFPKLAQILSTRYDLMSEDAIALLSRSCSQLRLAPALHHIDARGLELGGEIASLGAGAIAETFLVKTPEGINFVVKARRPGIDVVLRTDLAVIKTVANLANLLRICRSLNIEDNVRVLGELFLNQVDLEAERRNLRNLQANLGKWVRVPSVIEGGGSERIHMEYLPRGCEITAHDAVTRRHLAVSLLHLVYRMIFIDGFVHCDLHPGNIYVGEDGGLVIVDAGFCGSIDDAVRLDFREFFLAIGLKRAKILADIIIRYSTGAPDPQGATISIRNDCVVLLNKYSRLPSRAFRIVNFIRDLHQIYQKHRLTMTSEFFTIIYSLLVVEGTVTKLDGELDFQALAVQYMIDNREEIYSLRKPQSAQLVAASVPSSHTVRIGV
ncbi:AarF/ABC1/UbiB kinase family protein [Rhizobium sophoriradicis]|uniref:AarF/UbiB family protein n=1 Tax=Rhizobium sophoriradicis TaxID=1535245 RepID=UPI00098FF9BF|nr:AarF/UbiB family protein [Rhizobium sophoriradicis]RSB86876.1 AarF/ABC1/UbiB kinase family protein [Rhizobium sophoriradicis]